jgi:hypothetical protein
MYEKYQWRKISLQCREELNNFLTCNVTKKYFVTLFYFVIHYVTIFNFSLRNRVTLHNFFVTLRFFRYVTFRLQIPAASKRNFFLKISKNAQTKFIKIKKINDSGGIRTHASEETGALNQRLRPLGHAIS